MALNNIPISEDQCIGDSLDTINDSFVELDSRTLNLSSSVANLDTITASLSSTVASLTATVANLTLSATAVIYNKIKYTADGSVSYNASTLIGTQTSSFLYRVDVNGVVQEPGTTLVNGDYILSAGNLVFSTAPTNGTKIVIVGPSY